VETSPWLGGISRFEGHRRAFLKVQDGCDFGCSFCLIPRVRGEMVSRPSREILEEGKRLADQGVKELVLAGIQLSSYGRDLGKKASEARLAPVVEALLVLPGVKRVRLSSYAVADFEDALLPLFGRGLCAHLHLPLQSGDAGVLKAMRRPYRLEDFRDVVSKFRKAAPEGGLTSDVIAGFPGETEAAFQNTLDLLRELDFLDFHPFPYSDRPGTPGEALRPKVPPSVIRERMDALLALKRGCLEAAAHRAEGSLRRVIVERHGKGSQAGLTDEGLRLVIPERSGDLGQEAWMRVMGFQDGLAWAEWQDRTNIQHEATKSLRSS
jgi:threonylcarbamoyladenosine tRNA methylthiotransferase MtaB